MIIKFGAKQISCMMLFCPSVFFFARMVNSDGTISRVLNQIVLLLLFFKLIYDVIQTRRLAQIFVLFNIGLLVAINLVRHGIFYIMHADFYLFVLFLVVGTLFSDERYLFAIKQTVDNKRKVECALRMYYLLLLICILFFNGVRVSNEWGISMPILYGPSEVPHGLAYMQSVLFVLAYYWYIKSREKKYLFWMILSVICCFWTGARSGILGMTLIIIFLYAHTKNTNKKVLVSLCIVCVLLFLGTFTNVLTRNPVVEKTLSAFSNGSISNGRERFVEYLVDYYTHQTSLGEKIFGISMIDLRNIMEIRWKTGIHAHNDIINSLVGFGYFGLVLFCQSLLKLCRHLSSYIFMLLFLLVLALSNGLYMYANFTFCIPIIIVILKITIEGERR